MMSGEVSDRVLTMKVPGVQSAQTTILIDKNNLKLTLCLDIVNIKFKIVEFNDEMKSIYFFFCLSLFKQSYYKYLYILYMKLEFNKMVCFFFFSNSSLLIEK